jgi:hypothetical protein
VFFDISVFDVDDGDDDDDDDDDGNNDSARKERSLWAVRVLKQACQVTK